MDVANVSALHHRHQQGRGPPSFGGGAPPPRDVSTRGGFTMEKPIACPHAPCAGRWYPPNVCCVCDQPTHRVTRCCWHLLGLPTDRQARVVTAFKQLKDTHDPPFQARPRVAAIDTDDLDDGAACDPSPTYDAEVAAITTIADQSYLPVVDEDVAAVTAEMHGLESQFHPGYALPAHCASIDYFPRDSSDEMPDLYQPGDPGYTCTAGSIGIGVGCVSLPSLTSSTRVIIDSSLADVGDVTGVVVEEDSRLDTVVDNNLLFDFHGVDTDSMPDLIPDHDRSDPGRSTRLPASSRSNRLPNPSRSIRL
jgi:hypothetical protein